MTKDRRKRSILTEKDFYLSRHDEEKVLLFVAGILFGVGVSVAISTGQYWFSSLTLAAIGAILFFIEYRQD
jgi:hypothetical protein